LQVTAICALARRRLLDGSAAWHTEIHKCVCVVSYVPCRLLLIRSNPPNPSSHVQLRMLAHVIGIALGSTSIRFDQILQTVIQAHFLYNDTVRGLHTGQQTQCCFGTRVGLLRCLHMCVRQRSLQEGELFNKKERTLTNTKG
jgi:hypothetical protein